MKILVNRFVSDKHTTISNVSVDGKYICFGLEDAYHAEKIHGKTRIPAGTYQINMRTVGGFHSRYSKRFKGIHSGMLHIQDVPGYEYILIHCGNYDKDTAGCLLLGDTATTVPGNMNIMSSTQAYSRFYPLVKNVAIMGRLSITFQDNDGAK